MAMDHVQAIKRQYEQVILLRPDVSDAGRDAIKERVEGIVTEGDAGQIIRWETWGKRKLAYEIKKQTKAVYLYANFLTSQTRVAEIERNLRIAETVLTYQTVKLADAVGDDFDVEAESKKRTPLYVSPEQAAAAEREYRREQEWARAAATSGSAPGVAPGAGAPEEFQAASDDFSGKDDDSSSDEEG